MRHDLKRYTPIQVDGMREGMLQPIGIQPAAFNPGIPLVLRLYKAIEIYFLQVLHMVY